MIKPILFNTDMVRAILNGMKTVTRRVVKPQPNEDAKMRYVFAGGRKGDIGKWFDWNQGVADAQKWTPPCHAGDILYVREKWQCGWDLDDNGQKIPSSRTYYYAADGKPPVDFCITADGKLRNSFPWCPSIHMPKEAARIFLRVTDVRVERLQDITEEEKLAEGAPRGYGQYNFYELWDRTIKPADLPIFGWDANPWVWVIEFERIPDQVVKLATP